MSSPTVIRNILKRSGFSIVDWSGSSRIPKKKFSETPKKPGVYALYYGNSVQHIGSSIRGIKSRLNSQRNAQEDYKPHGSFSWFVLPKKQVQSAESLLIEKFNPPYSKRKPIASTRKSKNGRG